MSVTSVSELATVTGESVALHRGRTTMVWQTAIRSADGKLCAVVTQTQMVLDAPTKGRRVGSAGVTPEHAGNGAALTALRGSKSDSHRIAPGSFGG